MIHEQIKQFLISQKNYALVNNPVVKVNIRRRNLINRLVVEIFVKVHLELLIMIEMIDMVMIEMIEEVIVMKEKIDVIMIEMIEEAIVMKEDNGI